MLVDTYDTERASATRSRRRTASSPVCASTRTSRPRRCARARSSSTSSARRKRKIRRRDGLDEFRVASSRGADGFGVGENITCSPDAATGIGAVAKLSVNGYGKLTMKLAHGTGKATLPGELQVHRFADHDLVALADEAVPRAAGALLQPVWRGRGAGARPADARAESRADMRALRQICGADGQAAAALRSRRAGGAVEPTGRRAR